jgi:hypothetical protein
MICSYVIELNILGHIHPRFHVNLLKRAEDNLFPSLLIDGEPEYTIKEIKRARLKKMGRKNRRKILVKWKKYKKET